MRKEYKNFMGDRSSMSVDLDLERTDDFVNQVTYNTDDLFDFLDDDDIKITPLGTSNGVLDSDGDGIPDMIDIPAGSGTGKPTTTPSAPAPRANKGKGLGAFASGLTKGLGLINRGATPPPPVGDSQPVTDTAGFTNEGRNMVIPLLVGGIAILVVFLAISGMKKSGGSPQVSVSTPSPSNSNLNA
jgi:hypothetical protein